MSLSSFSAEDKAKAGLIQPKPPHIAKPYRVEPWKRKVVVVPNEVVEKIYWSVSELAEILQVDDSTIRFWTDKLDFKVKRKRKGDRQFTLGDIEFMTLIARAARELRISTIRRLMNEGPGRLAEVVRALEKKD